MIENNSKMQVYFCLRCNKRLTNPVSIERKYGPMCWRKTKSNSNMRKLVEVYG